MKTGISCACQTKQWHILTLSSLFLCSVSKYSPYLKENTCSLLLPHWLNERKSKIQMLKTCVLKFRNSFALHRPYSALLPHPCYYPYCYFFTQRKISSKIYALLFWYYEIKCTLQKEQEQILRHLNYELLNNYYLTY